MRTIVLKMSFLIFALAGAVLAGCQQPADPIAVPVALPTRAPVVTKTSAPAVAGVLVATGTMGSARAAHTATTLPDGRVLVAGGFMREENSAADAEVYDPVTGMFAATGPMLTPRHSHTATLLADGRVVLAGGYDAQGEYLKSAEVYDPASGTFASASPMTSARANHQAVLLQDGRVLLIGGVGTGWTFLSSTELYDPASAAFTPTGSMSFPRESHAAVRLADGRVLVVGGHQGRREAIELYTSAEIYDPVSGSFAPAGDLAIRRHKHDAVLLTDGQVLITGGTDERDNRGVYTSTEIYDPNSSAFRAGEDMQRPRYKHNGTSLLLPDGRVLLAGGATQAEVYDPQTDAFTLVGGEARMVGQFSASALLPDGRVLITGGYGENRGPQTSAWIYQP